MRSRSIFVVFIQSPKKQILYKNYSSNNCIIKELLVTNFHLFQYTKLQQHIITFVLADFCYIKLDFVNSVNSANLINIANFIIATRFLWACL